MRKLLINISLIFILVAMFCVSTSAASALSITNVSFNSALKTGSITFEIPPSLSDKSVTLIVKATNPADESDSGIAYIDQFDNVIPGTKTVDFSVRDTIDFGYLTFYIGATDITTPLSAEKLFGVLGDVNKDGKVTTFDGSLLLQYIAQLIPLDNSAVALGNIDTSTKVSITSYDVSLLVQFLANIPIEYPVG